MERSDRQARHGPKKQTDRMDRQDWWIDKARPAEGQTGRHTDTQADRERDGWMEG